MRIEYEKKAIYKIVNKINGHIYIGQTNNIERRFSDHITGTGDNKYSLIHRAIKKYGANNFTFEVLGWFEDYNEKEQYYIDLYRCRAPYGYNIQDGGNDPPHYSGEKNSFAKISEETARKVQEQALNWLIPRPTIVHENKITFDIFRHINEGDSWHRDDLVYPLRPNETVINEWKADKVIELLKNTKLSQAEIAKQVGWGRTAVTAINNGKNHFRKNETYPIRKQNNKTCND